MNHLKTYANHLFSIAFTQVSLTGHCAAPSGLSRAQRGCRYCWRLMVIWLLLIASAAIAPSSGFAQSARASTSQYQYCTVSCTASAPGTGTAGTAVSMSASASTVYCEGAPSYRWGFGDGTAASSEQYPSHTYANPGTYTWNLTVSADGTTCAQSGTIAISARTNSLSSVSAASFSGSRLASESIVAAFGTSLATATEVATTLPLPTTLAGTTVKVKDSANVERLAQLFFVAPGQVNYLIPPETAAGTATVTLTSGSSATSAGTMQIAAVAPGLFSANANGQGVAAAVALRIKANGAQSFEPVSQFDAAQNRFVSVPIDLGPADDQVFLILFGTGSRGRSALAAVTATIGGVNAEALFAGAAPGFVGLDQVNLRLSRSLAGRGEVDIALTVDGQSANVVRINIR